MGLVVRAAILVATFVLVKLKMLMGHFPVLVTKCGAVSGRRGRGMSIGKLSAFVYCDLIKVKAMPLLACCTYLKMKRTS